MADNGESQGMIEKAECYLPDVLARLVEYEAPTYRRFCMICGGPFETAAFDDHLCSAKQCAALYRRHAMDSLQHELDLTYEEALTVVKAGVDRSAMRVYFLRSRATGLIKIGSSAQVGARVQALQTASGEHLELIIDIPGGDGQEGLLHKRFANSRERGEWFRPTPELLELLGDLQDERDAE